MIQANATPFHAIALEESGITSFKALKGKRVGVGPSGGPPEVFFRGLAEMLSVKATLVAGTPAELAQKLLAKEIDAFWYGSGIPSPPFVEIADKAEAVVFGLAPDEAQALRRLFPISYRMRSRPAPIGDRQKACRRSRCGTSSSSMRPCRRSWSTP